MLNCESEIAKTRQLRFPEPALVLSISSCTPLVVFTKHVPLPCMFRSAMDQRSISSPNLSPARKSFRFMCSVLFFSFTKSSWPMPRGQCWRCLSCKVCWVSHWLWLGLWSGLGRRIYQNHACPQNTAPWTKGGWLSSTSFGRSLLCSAVSWSPFGRESFPESERWSKCCSLLQLASCCGSSRIRAGCLSACILTLSGPSLWLPAKPAPAWHQTWGHCTAPDAILLVVQPDAILHPVDFVQFLFFVDSRGFFVSCFRPDLAQIFFTIGRRFIRLKRWRD